MRHPAALGAVATLLLGVASCAEEGGASLTPAGHSEGGASGSSGDLVFETDGGFQRVTLSDGTACAAESRKAERVPLDMIIMLDKSGSMTAPTPGGELKWNAVRFALGDFINDTRSAGMGVGIAYFPLRKPGVPATCAMHTECGSDGGHCDLSVCTNSELAVPCIGDADCGGATDACQPYGLCSGDALYACSPIGSSCGALGVCTDFPRTCTESTVCDPDVYAAPSVPITLLPDGARALIASLNAEEPAGLTPTGPALDGALSYARQWAARNADHDVVAVFATDGLPTECLPPLVDPMTIDMAPIAKIASDALVGTPSVRTFVIGVLAADEAAGGDNLDVIARAGGSDAALIVDPGRDVAQQFLDALDGIRGAALPCDFEIPADEEGLDFGQINVEYVDDARRGLQLLNVGSAAGCLAHDDGWYYDADPSNGARPSRVSLCPRLCDALRATGSGTVNLLIGCETVVY